MGTGGPFPGGKARPSRDADHSFPSSAEVKNEYELYLLSSCASTVCSGTGVPLYLHVIILHFSVRITVGVKRKSSLVLTGKLH
jgi:hypothetical protein